MGSKPWLKVGSVLLAGMLLCGCQDPPRQNNGLIKAPAPEFPKATTGTGLNGAGNVPPNAWGGTAGKPTTSGFSSGVGTVGGLPGPSGTGFNNNVNNFNLSNSPGGLSNSSAPLPPANPNGFGSMPQGGSGFATGSAPSGAGGPSTPLPPVGYTGPGLPPVGAQPGPFPSNPGAFARP